MNVSSDYSTGMVVEYVIPPSSSVQNVTDPTVNGNIVIPESAPNAEKPSVHVLKIVDDNLQNLLSSTEIFSPDEFINVEDCSPEDNYVYQVLSESGEGMFLLELFNYEKDPEKRAALLKRKKCTYFDVHAVARLLIFHEYKRTKSYYVPPSRLELLAASAADLFKGYLKETFYSPGSSDSNAHGALQMFYNRFREKSIAIGKVNIRKRNYSESEENLSIGLQELQNPVQVIDEEYKKKWISTSQNERIAYYEKNDFKTIFITFINLRNPLGYILLEADFCSIFNKPENLFSQNWPPIAQKILRLAGTKADKELKELLKKTENVVKDEDKNLFALIVLPYIFRKITKLTSRSKVGKCWNPNKSEVLKTFIYHVKETENFSESLFVKDDLEKLHMEQHLIVEPYVVINGPSIDKIISAVVVIGDQIYQTSPLRAVDICFQTVKVCKKKFSHVSGHVWQFLERTVYEFTNINLHSCVTAVIEQVNRM